MDLPSRYGLEPVQVPDSTFEKALFERKLQELRLMGDFNREALNGLPDVFTMEEPHASISRAAKHLPEREAETKFITLNGPAVENKGIALFPRKIKGLYAMLGRQDAENRRVLRGSNGASWHNENSGRTCTPFVSNGLARSTDF